MHYIEQVFPAYAGVNPTFTNYRLMLKSIPRVCGGEPSQSLPFHLLSRYSPRMRG